MGGNGVGRLLGDDGDGYKLRRLLGSDGVVRAVGQLGWVGEKVACGCLSRGL